MRPAPRLYRPETLGSGEARFEAEKARYLGSVLRLRPGDAVRLFNGEDGEWTYRITSMEKRSGAAEPLAQRRRAEPRPSAPVLLFAPLKRSQTELLVQKSTELGAAGLQPVITARTNRDQLRLDRLEAIATEAAEQCERLDVPTIAAPVPLDEGVRSSGRFVFCDEAGDAEDRPWGGPAGRAPLAASVFPDEVETPRAILIGPEGGFTAEERDALRANVQAVPISLGPRILRAETAAIVALTLWQNRFGDLAAAPGG